MLEWLLRGLCKGRVTTRYPAADEPAALVSRGQVTVLDRLNAEPALQELCPTGAIHVNQGALNLDRGRCILCGLCVERAPERFAFQAVSETASRHRDTLWVFADSIAIGPRPSLRDQARPLGRSIHIRHVDAGSDGSEEWEIHALTSPYYDMQRLGLFFTAAPRHADILLVTGAVTDSMRAPLHRVYETMPEPKAVVAVGTDACSGGLAERSLGLAGVAAHLPVDVFVPGAPPTPIAILHGLLLAAGIVREEN
jgi:Ni,Fe-hydrogenase III small subunit/ferredoxin